MIMTIAPTYIASIHATIIRTIASTTSSFIASLTPSFIKHHSSLTFVQLWQRGAQYIIIYFVLRCILLEVCIHRECNFLPKIIFTSFFAVFCRVVVLFVIVLFGPKPLSSLPRPLLYYLVRLDRASCLKYLRVLANYWRTRNLRIFIRSWFFGVCFILPLNLSGYLTPSSKIFTLSGQCLPQCATLTSGCWLWV